jgi:8-oxo-dGTP diphosphatase
MAKHPRQPTIAVAADAAIFTVQDDALKVLLIRMKKKPFTGRWALPGGRLEGTETAEGSTRRILKTQTGVQDAYLEQLGTFDAPKRDPFGRVISVAQVALMRSEGVSLKTTEKYAGVKWETVAKAKGLAYDHDLILETAVRRLRAKLEYTNVVWSLMPETFSLSELQTTYESILGRTLDRRNFRKKILSLGLLVSTGKKRAEGPHRPAELYRFRRRELSFIDII